MFSEYLKSLAGGDLEKTASAEYDPVNVVLLHKEAADLSQSQREKLPSKSFAVPESKAKKIGVSDEIQGEAKGKYPIPDRSHARNALARVSQKGTPAEKKLVRSKVHAKYPDIGKEAAASCPGGKIRSKGMGRGMGHGGGEGPVGVPLKAKPKNKLSAMVKKAQDPGVLQRLGALSALQRAGELGVPVEYRRGTALRGAEEARGGAIRGAVGGGLAGGGLGAAAGLGAGALLKSPRAGTAIGALLGGAGGATLGAGAGATQAGRQAAEGTKEDIQEAMWTRAVANRQAQRAMAMQRLREIAANRHMQQGAYQMVPKVAAFNPFKDPTIMGTMIGGVTGAGLGVLSSENRDQQSLIRAGLIGAGMGGAIGGMSGALSKGVGATQKSHKQMQSTIQKATEEGFNKGWQGMADKILPRVKDLEAQLAAVKMR